MIKLKFRKKTKNVYFFADRIDEEMDQLWAEGKWDNERNEAVLKEHLRTPYKYAK